MNLSLVMTGLAIGAAAVGLIVVAAVADGGDRPLGLWSVAAGLAALGATAAATSVIGLTLWWGFFGAVHLLYLVAVVAVPVLGVGTLALARTRSARPAAMVAAGLLLVPAPIGIYATHIAPFRLTVERIDVAVDAERTGSDPVRLAVLADLQTSHVGDHERAAVRAVMDARPDLVVLPGDVFQGDEEQLRRNGAGVRELLEGLTAPGGVYLVEGDTDRWGDIRRVVPDHVVLLDDEVVDVAVGDRTVRLGGTRLAHATPSADAVRRQLVDSDAEITVLVSHRPGAVWGLPAGSGVDLVVAGHTHGGQVALPWIGPPVTLSTVPRDVGAGGLHELDGNPIYVSRGVGMERGEAPQVRFGVPPTVGILDLDG